MDLTIDQGREAKEKPADIFKSYFLRHKKKDIGDFPLRYRAGFS